MQQFEARGRNYLRLESKLFAMYSSLPLLKAVEMLDYRYIAACLVHVLVLMKLQSVLKERLPVQEIATSSEWKQL